MTNSIENRVMRLEDGRLNSFNLKKRISSRANKIFFPNFVLKYGVEQTASTDEKFIFNGHTLGFRPQCVIFSRKNFLSRNLSCFVEAGIVLCGQPHNFGCPVFHYVSSFPLFSIILGLLI